MIIFIKRKAVKGRRGVPGGGEREREGERERGRERERERGREREREGERERRRGKESSACYKNSNNYKAVTLTHPERKTLITMTTGNSNHTQTNKTDIYIIV